jgi:hypothetical protein
MYKGWCLHHHNTPHFFGKRKPAMLVQDGNSFGAHIKGLWSE